MIIKREPGYAIEKNVDVAINSANGLLHMDSSGAGVIREHSEELTKEEKEEYDSLFSQLSNQIQKYCESKQKSHGWENRRANLSAVKLLLKQIKEEGRQFDVGDAVIDKEWSSSNPRKVIHAITMSYDPETKERINGSILSIQTSIEAALRLALSLDANTIAIPIACAREGYGVSPEQSEETVERALGILKDEPSIKEVILCYDNMETESLLEESQEDE